MLEIRCKNCGKQLVSHPSRIQTCGCPNLTSIRGTNISGNNLSLVEIVQIPKQSATSDVLSNDDLQYQEQRRKRKIRRIDFEER